MNTKSQIYPTHVRVIVNPKKVFVDRENRLSQEIIMNSAQFDSFKSQLSQLTPQQLRSLQGEINQSLETKHVDLVTTEELELIAQLFS